MSNMEVTRTARGDSLPVDVPLSSALIALMSERLGVTRDTVAEVSALPPVRRRIVVDELNLSLFSGRGDKKKRLRAVRARDREV